MNNFIFKASTMRGKTELALSMTELKKKINDALDGAADKGEYWCHFIMPTLIDEKVVDNIVTDLLDAGYKVKVTYNKGYYLTIQWAPEDSKVVFDGEEWV